MAIIKHVNLDPIKNHLIGEEITFIEKYELSYSPFYRQDAGQENFCGMFTAEIMEIDSEKQIFYIRNEDCLREDDECECSFIEFEFSDLLELTDLENVFNCIIKEKGL